MDDDTWSASYLGQIASCSTGYKRMRISEDGHELSNTSSPYYKVENLDLFTAAEVPEVSKFNQYGSVARNVEKLKSLYRKREHLCFIASLRKNEMQGGSTAAVEPITIDSDDEETDHRSLPTSETLPPKSAKINEINGITIAQTSESGIQRNESTKFCFTKSALAEEDDQDIEKEDDLLNDIIAKPLNSKVLRRIVNDQAAENETHGGSTAAEPIIIIDSDDEEPDQRNSPIFQTLLPVPTGKNDTTDTMIEQISESSVQGNEMIGQAAEFQFAESDRCALVQEYDQTMQKKGDHLVDVLAQTSESSALKSTVDGRAAEFKIPQTSSSVWSNEVNGQAAEFQFTKSKGACATIQEEDQKIEKKEKYLDDIVARISDRRMVNGLDAKINVRTDRAVFVEVDEDQQTDKEDGFLHNIVTHNTDNSVHSSEVDSPDTEIQVCKDRGIYVGVEEEDEQSVEEDDSLDDIWRQMYLAAECSKEANDDEPSQGDHTAVVGDCDHSFILKDDIGYVCRICGFISQGIDTIFEFQYNKVKRGTRTYMSEPRYPNEKVSNTFLQVKYAEDELAATEISAHPRHMKHMKPHQMEGFKFLCSNLVADSPGGCIMAHAPGSGKTFMIISFVQSFLGKYPQAKPLVILPKGILGTWKKEFHTWQVENLVLLDFYSAKADKRNQQFEVLKQWVEEKSILFLGYKQFSSILCDSGSDISSACQEMLLKIPTVLILDEGHTPRNENTEVLQSLARVQTPRKVVLSGTLYQNHVKEVFNVRNLVRPKFLRLDTSRVIQKRIMSRVDIAGVRKHIKSSNETAFYDLVEHTLQNDEDFKRKVSVIKDLREMTSKVLHYYKGDSLDELPGLVDFTVVLKLSPIQKDNVDKLKKQENKFKINSIGSSLYVHPSLIYLSDNSSANDEIDKLLERLDIRDGVKAKFFLNMLNLCESADEKLLVFSQFLLPLKFLERLVVKAKSWSLGREIFGITGDSSYENREWSMERFNSSKDAKVFFGSIKACGEGISLVGASRIIILDVHLNPSVTRQAIGRAFRPGQSKKVYAYRLVADSSPEQKDHATCFRKELISKLWFEWNEYCGFQDFMMETSSVEACGDLFLESPALRENIISLHIR